MLAVPFRGSCKNAVLVPPRVFSLKTSTTGPFAVPYRVLISWAEKCQVIFYNQLIFNFAPFTIVFITITSMNVSVNVLF